MSDRPQSKNASKGVSTLPFAMASGMASVVASVMALSMADPACAVAVGGRDGTPAQGRRQVQAAPAEAGSPALTLARGRIESIDHGRGQIVMAGKAVALHPTQLRVFGPSGQSEPGASALRKGMAMRFALDPASKSVERPIVLIYIDAP